MDFLELTAYGALSSGYSYIGILIVVLLVCVLGFTGAPLQLWTLFSAAGLWGFGVPIWLWIVFGAWALIFNVRPTRRRLISAPMMTLLKKVNFLPTISETEQTVIETGTVWVEGELFSGKPDFRHLLNEPYPPLGDLCGLQRDINPFFLIKDLVQLLVPRDSADMREAKEWGERVRDASMVERVQLSTNFRLDSV